MCNDCVKPSTNQLNRLPYKLWVCFSWGKPLDNTSGTWIARSFNSIWRQKKTCFCLNYRTLTVGQSKPFQKRRLHKQFSFKQFFFWTNWEDSRSIWTYAEFAELLSGVCFVHTAGGQQSRGITKQLYPSFNTTTSCILFKLFSQSYLSKDLFPTAQTTSTNTTFGFQPQSKPLLNELRLPLKEYCEHLERSETRINNTMNTMQNFLAFPPEQFWNF